MVDVLKPVISQPGVYRIPATAPETPSGSGIYTLEGGFESPAGSDVFAFPEGPAFEVETVQEPPYARLTFDAEDLPDSTHTIKVYRSYDGLTGTVRSAWGLFASGGAVLTDSEIPLGVPVTYQAEAFDTDGNGLGKTGSVTVQVDCDPSTGWFSDPTDPNLVVKVDLKGDFANALTTARQVQTYQVGDRIVALLGALGKLQNINIRVQTDTIEDGQMLGRVLAQTSVLIRTAPPADVPRLLYVIVPEFTKTGTGSLSDIQFGGGTAMWQGTGQEVSTTTLDILVPLVTWQSAIDAFEGATWQQVIDFYAGKSWFEVIKEFSAGGA